jgi:multiple sugar transport system permease protein
MMYEQTQRRADAASPLHRLSRQWERYFHYALLLPLIVGLAVLIGFPLLYGLYYSFTNYRLLSADAPRWIGLDNYVRLFGDADFRAAAWHTAIFGLFGIHLEFVIAFGLALLLARQVRGIGLLRTLYLIPYMVGGVLVGFQYRWFFNDQFGLANNFLVGLGVIDSPIAWLVRYPMASVIAASIWHTAPFTAMLLLAGLLAIPDELYQASAIDGAGRVQQFCFVTLPMLLPLIVLVLTLRYLAVPPVFDHIMVMTGGGPALQTDVLMTYIVRTAVQKGLFGRGAAASYLLLLIQMLLLVWQLRVIQRLRHGGA